MVGFHGSTGVKWESQSHIGRKYQHKLTSVFESQCEKFLD